MENSNDNKKIFDQDLTQKEKEAGMYCMWLLFEKKPQRPSVETIHNELTKAFGDVDIVFSHNNKLSGFGIKKYISRFKDGEMPTQLIMGDIMDFEQDFISDFERGQLWDCEDGNAILERCTHKLFISDMMDRLEYKEKTEMLMDWLEIAVKLFPDCTAVWIPSGGKLIIADKIRNYQFDRNDRFIHFGVNARFFTIQGKNDMIVDTRGLYAIGLPDIQCHFHNLNPNDVVGYVYTIASYIYCNDQPIKNGDTVDGLLNGSININVQWKCHYEDALVQPARPVIDICAGEFASGGREYLN